MFLTNNESSKQNIRNMIRKTTIIKEQQSSQKTEANIKKWLLQTMLSKNKQPLLQTSCTGHNF